MQQKTDADLVMLACMGKKDANDELIRRYQGQAKRVALKIVRQEELAREITQEAFLAAYLSLDQLRNPARFGSWLISIVRNFALSVWNEQRKKPVSLEQILHEHPTSVPESLYPLRIDPEAQVEEEELQELLLAIIATLSEKERSAVLLYYYQQHTIQEIASLLDISVSAVKSRLFKARRTLRGQLTAEYELVSPQIVRTKGKAAMSEEQQTLPSDLTMPDLSSIQILMIAYTEARLLDQPFIGTEHVFLALLHPEAGLAMEQLQQMGIYLEQARQAVQAVSPHLQGEMARGMSRDALDVIEGSMRLAQYMQDRERLPMHMLISLLTLDKNVACQAVAQMGKQPALVRDQIVQYVLSSREQAIVLDKETLDRIIPRTAVQFSTPSNAIPNSPRFVDPRRENDLTIDIDKMTQSLQNARTRMLEKYPIDDPRHARFKQVFESSQRRLELSKRPDMKGGKVHIGISYTDVLVHANTVRQRFNHIYTAAEHLLYSILEFNSSQARAAQLLDRLQVVRPLMREELERFLDQQQYDVPGITKGRTTLSADKAIDYAYEEAYRFRHSVIGAEHILIGLARLSDDFCANVMKQMGLDAEKLREELAQLPDPVL